MSLTTGVEHSPTSATGTGWERTPWHATQRAAWEALKKAGTSGLDLGPTRRARQQGRQPPARSCRWSFRSAIVLRTRPATGKSSLRRRANAPRWRAHRPLDPAALEGRPLPRGAVTMG
jgi:hypothetical protein